MHKFISKSRLVKVLAIFLAVLMFCGTQFDFLGVVLSADFFEFTPYISLGGEKVEEIILEEDAKLNLEAFFEDPDASHRWQIKYPSGDDRWIDIANAFAKDIWLTYSLIGSMLNENGTAMIRCRSKVGEEDIFTDPVTVKVSYNVPEVETPEFENYIVNNINKTDLVVKNETKNVVKSAATPSAAADSNSSGNNEYKTYTIVVNYLFDDNTMAYEPYGASVAAGDNFNRTVPSPDIVGYTPVRLVDGQYKAAESVVFDLKNIQSDIVVNVIYQPKLVNVTIHHYLQNIENDGYATEPITKVVQKLTGTKVGSGLAMSSEDLPGFTSLDYETELVVAADGSTVVEIRYDRNYYLIDFDMNGGYGTEPIYTRYGTPVGANKPTRHGYVFDEWQLVKYGGQAPTIEQQAMYAIGDSKTITVPAANLSYKAKWLATNTTYTLVFWQENADDNGYSYWGYYSGLTAVSGSFVSGQDLISKVDGITDEQYFTFNSAKTDKNVLVEGDGSTIVNVYYTRNYYTITIKAPGLCTIPTGHTHTDSCYDLICGMGHTHTSSCSPILICTTDEHTAHTASCTKCGKVEHIHGSVDCTCNKVEHTHTKDCWNNVGNKQTYVSNAPNDPEDGEIHSVKSGGWWNTTTTYYIYIVDSWYIYNGSGVYAGDVVDPKCGYTNHKHGSDCTCEEEAHVHSDSCYKDTLHTHTDICYKYSCGDIEHIHSDVCKRLNCVITEKHSHSSSCTKSSNTNVVKKIYAKYKQTLTNIWPIVDDNKIIYNSGERWTPSDSSYYNQVLVYIANMPPDDFTLTVSSGADRKDFEMNYYVQALPGESGTVTVNGKNYNLFTSIRARYNHLTKTEDFFDIEGFKQSSSNPAFSNNQVSGTSGKVNVVDMYYDRSDYQLTFNNNGTVLSAPYKYTVKYEAPLASYYFAPSYPDNLEPGAYQFGGWYTSPGCFAGTEVDWDAIRMPAGDMMLYAKWEPIQHRVEIYKDSDLDEPICDPQYVAHNDFATAPAGNISNGNYIFQGWFYRDAKTGVEKAFVFNGIPIVSDMKIYAKWSSHVAVDYTIYYKLKGTDTNIAPPTTGKAIAGNNKTFDAKTGDELYAGYRNRYYPHTKSHTIAMSPEGNHVFTFYYEYVETMPYKVQYIDKDTNQKLAEDKVVMNNDLSVVTETFVAIPGMMPDAYQKRLVLSTGDTGVVPGEVSDVNVITFYYKKDEKNAFYKIVHYVQNVEGSGYREYRSEEAVGVIGSEISVSAIELTGFKYIPGKTLINNENVNASGDTVKTTITAAGALIELYYDRLSYSYVVKYLDYNTNNKVHDDKIVNDVLFGKQVEENALNLESVGYELANDSTKIINISANEANNVIIFYYKEKDVTIKYQIVGPTGCGILSQTSENVKAISGEPIGSYPMLKSGFALVGWYTDPDCKNPVNPDFVSGENNMLKPEKAAGTTWSAVTYYAKVVALETDLTIKTTSTSASDADQVFIFHVKGKADTDTKNIDITVTIVGDGSVTLTKLPTGDYTITELTDWSWRYENATPEREITVDYNNGVNEVVYDNSRENGKWLDGNDVVDNKF